MVQKPAINYTNVTYESIQAAIKAWIQAKFPDTWSDMYESSMGQVWVEAVAYAFDQLNFGLNYAANEVYLPSARDRQSVMDIGKAVGYQMRTATAASVKCTVSIASVQAKDVVIPPGVTLTATSGVTFRTLEQWYIPAGSLSAEIYMSEGVAHSDSFTSDGSSFQKFKLTTNEVVHGSITASVSGTEWTKVDGLIMADSATQAYEIEYDVDDYGYVKFGDGTNGIVPAMGEPITVNYRVGGGLAGNVAVGEINQVDNNNCYLRDILPTTYVAVTFYNSERGTGGLEAETVEHAKMGIPHWTKAAGRAVTINDFNILAVQFNDPTYGSPAFASAKLKYIIPEYNIVQMFLWARDNGGNIVVPSSGLKDAIFAYFMNDGTNSVRVACTEMEVEDGGILKIDVNAELTVDSDYSIATVEGDVSTALNSFFDSTDVIPGYDIRLSHVYRIIQDVSGVLHTLIVNVTAHRETSEVLAGTSGTFDLPPGQPIAPGSVVIADDSNTLTDDKDGNLVGDGSGTIDYDTGAYSFTLTAPSGDIVATYGIIEMYQRGKAEQTLDGTTETIKGVLQYPPVIPIDPVSGANGIAFAVADRVVVDDGNGNLVGDVNPLGVNRIDYDTGAYEFTLSTLPANGSILYSTYKQLLRVNAEDIPIDASDMPVKGTWTFSSSS